MAFLYRRKRILGSRDRWRAPAGSFTAPHATCRSTSERRSGTRDRLPPAWEEVLRVEAAVRRQREPWNGPRGRLQRSNGSAIPELEKHAGSDRSASRDPVMHASCDGNMSWDPQIRSHPIPQMSRGPKLFCGRCRPESRVLVPCSRAGTGRSRDLQLRSDCGLGRIPALTSRRANTATGPCRAIYRGLPHDLPFSMPAPPPRYVRTQGTQLIRSFRNSDRAVGRERRIP